VTTLGALATTRVSFREVKEESYRALRQAGYSWGMAQVAGRCAGVAQVLWGSGVSAVLRDANRWGVVARPPRSKTTGDTVVISARGMSWAMVGPLAVAVALGNKRPVVWVRGALAGPELAATVWDLRSTTGESLVWGSKSSAGWAGFEVTPAGDLHSSGVPHTRIGAAPSGASWFVCAGEGEPGGVILSGSDKAAQLGDAHREGVSIAESEWAALERLARKFLVPE